MGFLSRKGGNKASPSSNVEDEKETNIGAIKNAEDELDTSNIKVPAIPGTEKRVTLRAIEKTSFGHQAGEEFSVAEVNAERILKTGKYEKIN